MNETIQRLLDNQSGQHIFPFFWLKGESEEVLREYMQVIKNANLDAVCLESRPHPDFCGPRWWRDLKILLEEAKKLQMKVWILDDSHFPTGFCNGAIAEEIEKGNYSHVRRSVTLKDLGLVRIPGESRTLSGDELRSAGEGAKTEADLYFMKKVIPADEDELLDVIAEEEISKQLFSFRREGLLTERNRSLSIPSSLDTGNWKLYGLFSTSNRGPHRDYMNMLDQDACGVLLKTVYEPHYEHFKEYFGNVIEGFFSDEPEIGNGHIYQLGKRFYEVEDLAWSSELQTLLMDRWGEEWTENAFLLWKKDEKDPGKKEKIAQIRYDYMDAVTRQVQKCFSEQIGGWCRAHGVKYIGHMIEDMNQHSRCGSSLGHYFRGLAGQDMSGIDDIGGQVLPQGEDLDIATKWQKHRDGSFYHFCLGKLAASAAAIDPLKKGRAMCEIFGNYGWKEGVYLEKYLADHFLVRGINHYVPHAFSAAAFPDPDCPPHFYAHGHNPQYRHFGQLMQYMERICCLISQGCSHTPAAILYHAEADWTSEDFQFCEEPARKLAEAQIDYHFIPSDVFANQSQEEEKGEEVRKQRENCLFHLNPEKKCFSVGNQTYQVLVIPQTEWITMDVACALQKMWTKGIPVCFLEKRPIGFLGPKEVHGVKIPMEDIPCLGMEELTGWIQRMVNPEIQITPSDPFLRILSYERDYQLYFFVNEGSHEYRGTARINGLSDFDTLYEYDAWNNRIINLDESEGFIADEVRQDKIGLRLEPGKSLLLIGEGKGSKAENRMAPSHQSLLEKTCEEPNQNEIEYDKSVVKEQVIPLTDFIRSVCPSVDYPVFRDYKSVSLPDLLEKEVEDFGGFVRYETVIPVEKNNPDQKMILEIRGQEEGIEVFLNGKSLGIQIVSTYRYDLTPYLLQGNNKLTIEKATTLERVVPKEKIRGMLWTPPENHCGITGTVQLILKDSMRDNDCSQ